jgi:hypothetical protein
MHTRPIVLQQAVNAERQGGFDMLIDALGAHLLKDGIVIVEDPVPCHEVPPNGCPLYVYPQFPSN